jgi:hypothetical protein
MVGKSGRWPGGTGTAAPAARNNTTKTLATQDTPFSEEFGAYNLNSASQRALTCKLPVECEEDALLGNQQATADHIANPESRAEIRPNICISGHAVKEASPSPSVRQSREVLAVKQALRG